MATGLRDVSLRHKNRRTRKRKTTQIIRTNPPLSAASEAEFYVEEEERGVYDEFWRNMGYYVEHGVDYPPYPSSQGKRPNNRASGWSGTFAFTFYWKEAGKIEQQEISRTLLDEYHCDVVPGEESGPWTATVRLNGKRVKNLTRMLNRRYAKNHLIWKEL
jgi:hypothetical protein